MRRPALKACIWLVSGLIGVGLLWLANNLSGDTSKVVTGVCFCVGIAVVVVSPFLLIQSILAAIGTQRLLAGHGVIAQWHVPNSTWEQFAKLDAERNRQSSLLVNDFHLRANPSPDGAEVIVGRRQLIVDGSYHVLRPRGIPELRGVRWLGAPADPECLEFDISYPRKYGSTRLCLRVPVPFTARDQANRTYYHFQSIIPQRHDGYAFRKPDKTIRGGLIVAAFFALLGLAGWIMTQTSMKGEGAMITMMIGVMATIGALFFTGVIALATQPWRRR